MGYLCVYNKQVWRHDEVGEAVQYRLLQSDSNLWELKRREGKEWDSNRKRLVLGAVCMYFSSLCVTIQLGDWFGCSRRLVFVFFFFFFLPYFLIQYNGGWLALCRFRWVVLFDMRGEIIIIILLIKSRFLSSPAKCKGLAMPEGFSVMLASCNGDT